MFSLGSLWLIFLLQTGAALEYPELYTHSARMGSSTTIPCKFNVDAIPPARRSFTMLWHFQEKEVFRSPNALKAADPRLSIDQDRIQDGIADLSMSRVSISDGGLYICSMVQTPERKVKEIRLDIHAPPQITITNKTALINKESVLRCAISGFYPVDIDIKWLRNGEILDHVIMEIPQRGPDGTYSVNSSVTITPTEEDRERIFSCRIQHESLTAPLQEDFRLMFEDEEITKQNIIIIISVAVPVGVILIVIITVIMCKKKGKVQKTRNSINNENESITSNQQPEAQEEPNHFQTTGTKPAVHWKPSAVYSPGGRHSDEENQHTENTKLISGNESGGRRSDKEAENQDNENQKLTSGDESGDVRQPRDSINDTNKTSKRNQQPEPREGRNHSQTTGTRSAVHPKPPDRTVYSPGDVQETQQSIYNTNKTPIRNQQPEPREESNHSQMTSTRSAVHSKPPDTTVSSPGDPSLENQRAERPQTMPEDQETEPSANNQEEEMKYSKGHVMYLRDRFENINTPKGNLAPPRKNKI